MNATDLKASLFAPFGPIAVKRMFGGSGIYAEGLCFAIELKGEVFLKTDALSQAEFPAAGSTPFVYVAKGKARPSSYWSLPAAAHEDGDELRRWASAGTRGGTSCCRQGKAKKGEADEGQGLTLLGGLPVGLGARAREKI